MCHVAHVARVTRRIEKKKKIGKKEKVEKSVRHKERPEKKARASTADIRGSVKSFGTACPCLPILLVIDVACTACLVASRRCISVDMCMCGSFSSFLYTRRECRLLLHTVIYIGEEGNGCGVCMRCDYEAQCVVTSSCERTCAVHPRLRARARVCGCGLRAPIRVYLRTMSTCGGNVYAHVRLAHMRVHTRV